MHGQTFSPKYLFGRRRSTIKKILLFENAPSLQLSQFKGDDFKYYHFAVKSETFKTCGYGDGISLEQAQIKATYEFIERVVFKTMGYSSESSSGWAAHTSLAEARLNAKNELIERDAVLLSWLAKCSPRLRKDLKLSSFSKTMEILEFSKQKNYVVLGAIVQQASSKVLVAVISSCCATS